MVDCDIIFHSEPHIALIDCDNIIYLSIYDMVVECRNQQVSFENLFSQCISHEIIHAVLGEIDRRLTNKFDNICRHKHGLNIKEWHGGMPYVIGDKNGRQKR